MVSPHHLHAVHRCSLQLLQISHAACSVSACCCAKTAEPIQMLFGLYQIPQGKRVLLEMTSGIFPTAADHSVPTQGRPQADALDACASKRNF